MFEPQALPEIPLQVREVISAINRMARGNGFISVIAENKSLCFIWSPASNPEANLLATVEDFCFFNNIEEAGWEILYIPEPTQKWKKSLFYARNYHRRYDKTGKIINMCSICKETININEPSTIVEEGKRVHLGHVSCFFPNGIPKINEGGV